MSATVDGNAWTAVQVTATNNGTVVNILGLSAAPPVGVGINLVGQAPGTYTIGPTSTASGNVTAATPPGGWLADPSRGSGTITFTALTATRASGTFSFTAPLALGTGSPATRVVTNGTFNVTF